MTTLLVKNSHTLVTMNAGRDEIRHGALFVRDNVIEQVGTTEALGPLADQADDVLDLGDRHIVLPGLVNTHHHFFQTLTRVIPAVQDGDLFQWLQGLYPIWAGLSASDIAVSAQMAAAELMLSGCTTASDHLYIFPNDCTLDDEIHAVQATGLRFHASRGSMSVGQSQGGLPPDTVVEDEAAILRDSQRLIEQYHDSSRYSMLRLVLAPCSPFSVSPDLMRESAALARSYAKVHLHTHLAESPGDVDYSRERFDMTPGEYAESVGWLGNDVWHAHCVQLSDRSIDLFARTGTGVAHCPCSNCRLASGIAPIRNMLARGVSVGLGVDGAASNDATHLLNEARTAFLLARVREGDAAAMTARQALALATVGGAKVLGRDDIGVLAPGMAADFVAFDLDQPTFAGTHDPVAALIFCQPSQVSYSVINGSRIIDNGQLTALDVAALGRQAQAAGEKLLERAESS